VIANDIGTCDLVLSCSGEDADVLSAFVYDLEDRLDRIDDYCGSATPLAIMSSGNKLTLEFKAPSSSPYVRGFSALYSFVEGKRTLRLFMK
jgi:hypothetical protein